MCTAVRVCACVEAVKVVPIPVKVNSTESAAGRRLVILLAKQGLGGWVAEEGGGGGSAVHSHSRHPLNPFLALPPPPPPPFLCPPAALPGLPIQEQRSHLVFVWDTFTRQGALRFVVRATVSEPVLSLVAKC